MAEAMTYNSLVEDLKRYLERGYAGDTEVLAQIPRLITLAERSLARAIKVQGFLVPYITAMAAGVSVYAKPARWRETVSMNIGTGTSGNSRKFLYPRSYEYCRAYWPDSDERELPLFYSDYDYDHWLVVPTPEESYNWEIMVYQIPPLLGPTNQTNWLTDYAPNALLYRSLIEASPFLKNDNRIQTWQGLYEAEIAHLDIEDLQNIANRASVRTED
jgi:hypothetical protein